MHSPLIYECRRAAASTRTGTFFCTKTGTRRTMMNYSRTHGCLWPTFTLWHNNNNNPGNSTRHQKACHTQLPKFGRVVSQVVNQESSSSTIISSYTPKVHKRNTGRVSLLTQHELTHTFWRRRTKPRQAGKLMNRSNLE